MLSQTRSHCEKHCREEAESSAADAPPPVGHGQQQSPMPEAQDPAGLIRALADHGHKAATDDRRERGDLRGEIQQCFNALPPAGAQQPQLPPMLNRAAEVFRLIPGGQALVQLQPGVVEHTAQAPDQPEGQPPEQALVPPGHQLAPLRRVLMPRLRHHQRVCR